jgi:hypothetical protein
MSIEIDTMVAAIASTLVYYKPKNMNDFHTAGSVYDAIGPARSTRTQMFELNTLKLAFSSDMVHAAMDKLANPYRFQWRRDACKKSLAREAGICSSCSIRFPYILSTRNDPEFIVSVQDIARKIAHWPISIVELTGIVVIYLLLCICFNLF